MPITEADVKAILAPGQDYDLENNPPLAPFIESAGATVADLVAYGVEIGVTVDATRQDILHKWIAAHDYKLSDKDRVSASTMDASVSFAGQTGMGFDATLYGQRAKRLDPTGFLALQDGEDIGTVEAGGVWLGKNPSEQTEYGT